MWYNAGARRKNMGMVAIDEKLIDMAVENIILE
jgi:hypothetical protein